MNKKQAIKSRQATKASENVQQEIHAADILKGNKVTVENTPAAVRAHKLNSLEEQIIANQEKIIRSRDDLIDDYATYTDALRERINEHAGDWRDFEELVMSQQDTLFDKYGEIYKRKEGEQVQAYEREIKSLKERIGELEDTVRVCIQFYEEQIEDWTGKAGSATVSNGKGKWKIVRDHEGGTGGKILEGWCIVS